MDDRTTSFIWYKPHLSNKEWELVNGRSNHVHVVDFYSNCQGKDGSWRVNHRIMFIRGWTDSRLYSASDGQVASDFIVYSCAWGTKLIDRRLNCVHFLCWFRACRCSDKTGIVRRTSGASKVTDGRITSSLNWNDWITSNLGLGSQTVSFIRGRSRHVDSHTASTFIRISWSVKRSVVNVGIGYKRLVDGIGSRFQEWGIKCDPFFNAKGIGWRDRSLHLESETWQGLTI